jgi:cytochrome b561
VWFGVLPLPDLLDKNAELAETLEEVHEILGQVLLALVGLHAAAALKHHFFDRDEVLARMVPGLRPRTKASP